MGKQLIILTIIINTASIVITDDYISINSKGIVTKNSYTVQDNNLIVE